jgi:hypothetical protein
MGGGSHFRILPPWNKKTFIEDKTNSLQKDELALVPLTISHITDRPLQGVNEGPGVVVFVCNPGYSGDRDERIAVYPNLNQHLWIWCPLDILDTDGCVFFSTGI